VGPEEIAAAIGAEFIRRLAHGESSGAYEIVLANGDRGVLKQHDLDVAGPAVSRDITDTLRTRGYPAPATLAAGEIDGTGYRITELLAGESVEKPTPEMLPRLVELIGMHRAIGIAGRAPWLEDMITSVVDGRTGYCEHASLAAHSDETRALLDRVRRIADDARNTDVPVDDAVHYDFSPYNILATGNTITGVVDWDGATVGDAAFDLVTLAMYTFDFALRDKLLAAARASTDPRAVRLYAAHMVLRQADWSLRNHGELEVAWFLGIGAALLAAVGAE